MISWSHSPWVPAPQLALGWQCGACLVFSLCPSLACSLTHTLSFKINKWTLKKMCQTLSNFTWQDVQLCFFFLFLFLRLSISVWKRFIDLWPTFKLTDFFPHRAESTDKPSFLSLCFYFLVFPLNSFSEFPSLCLHYPSAFACCLFFHQSPWQIKS